MDQQALYLQVNARTLNEYNEWRQKYMEQIVDGLIGCGGLIELAYVADRGVRELGDIYVYNNCVMEKG